MKHSLTLLFLLFCLATAMAQIDFTGSWKGTLTQNAGGYRSKYQFELYLIQKGKKITGRSYVAVDNIYATLEIEGEVIDGQTVRFRETDFINFSELQNLEWCYKTAVLQFRRSGASWRLEGPWEGVTSFGRCIPGKIYITLEKPQA